MKITKYQQSCILIETENKKILIDPGDMVDEEIIRQFKEIDFILYTHTHNDHCFVEYHQILSNNNNALVIGNHEIAEKLSESKVEIWNEEDSKKFENIKIEMTKAVHGFYFAMGSKPLPKPNGFIIRDQKTSIYHCSDTIAFYHNYQADVILVPICGHGIVMEPEIAIDFSLNMNAKLTIPIHYENHRHPQGTEKFEKIAKEKRLNYALLGNGKSIEI